LRDLRAFTQHYQLPVTAARLSFTTTNPATGEGIHRQGVILPKQELLKWNGWHTEAKRYLARFGSDLDLGEVLKEHHAQTSGLFAWLDSRVRELYKTEIDDVVRLESEMQKLLSEDKKEQNPV
jgi:hypothetical protein